MNLIWTEIGSSLKGSKILSFFIKIDRFPEKLWSFLKKAKGSNFAVESEWKSKLSQNIQTLGFGGIKEYFGSSRKTEVF